MATYGFAGTLGPSAVAAISAWFSPSEAFYFLAVGTVIAAFFIMRLPSSQIIHAIRPTQVSGAIATMGLMINDTRLRRTLYLTMAVAFAVAVLPVVAVNMAKVLDVPAATAAFLTVAYGAGNLAGSMCLMVLPLRGEPDRLMLNTGWLVVGGLLAIFVASGFLSVFVCFFITGMINSAFFAATLAARSEYSPSSCRGQVFVWVGAMKITAGSLGTAAAGQLMILGAYVPLGLSLCTLSTVLIISLLTHIWPSMKSHH